jgi:phage shock protein A
VIDWPTIVVIALLLLVLLGLAIVARHLGRQTAETSQRSVSHRALDSRLTRLEARVDHLPTHRDLLDLRAAVGEVSESVAQINGQTAAISQMLRSIQEHVLEGDHK